VKELYHDDTDFGAIYFQYELAVTNGFCRHDEFLFKDKDYVCLIIQYMNFL
jgi:hypothetical protein